MDQDIKFLKEALKLAKKGLGRVNPNPMVGAVIVKNGRIIGKGYHHGFGLPHAEIEALKNCRQNPKGATLYINLEPCTHFGKTPPCTDAIIKAGIKKVVCCSMDPNPKAHDKAGIEISVSLLEKEARQLNEAFFTFHEKQRPFIAIKFAASLDGKLATYTGDSKWITNEKARAYARSLRGEYQAVLVGINTVLKDNPHLGDSLRIILGSKVPKNSQVLRDKNVLIINPKNIKDLLEILRKKEIISVLVEGGGKTLGSFIDAKVVDKVYAFHAPIIIGGEKAISISGKGASIISQALHLKNLSLKKFNDNLLAIGYIEN